MARQMHAKDELSDITASQCISKQSPRVKNRQAPSFATPTTKKALEYAGPSFNHSPAPANLPPPPFLSKLVSQSSLSDSPQKYAYESNAPSALLFDTRLVPEVDRDASIHQSKIVNNNVVGSKVEHNEAARTPGSLREAGGISRGPGSAENTNYQKQSTIHSTTTSQSTTDPGQLRKPNPWLRDKARPQHPPATISLSDVRHATTQYNYSSMRKPLAQDTRRKKTKASKTTATESTPRAILKRPTQVSATKRQPGDVQAGLAQTARPNTESTYVPLQKHDSNQEVRLSDSQQALSQTQAQEEELLRLQTSQLMSLLEIQPDISLRSSSNEGSAHENKSTSKDGMEADLRRVLRLGV